LENKHTLSLQVYDDKGNTLLHLLVQRGDSHVEVLAELLNAYKPDKSDKKIFDMNKFNLKKETPLHMAVLKDSTTVVDILVQHGSRLDLAVMFYILIDIFILMPYILLLYSFAKK
jgi:ankyrin repeat protein